MRPGIVVPSKVSDGKATEILVTYGLGRWTRWRIFDDNSTSSVSVLKCRHITTFGAPQQIETKDTRETPCTRVSVAGGRTKGWIHSHSDCSC